MNKRFIGVLLFATIVATVASLLLYRLLINRPQTTKAAVTTTQIVLAARDIDVGTVLKEEDVKLADWPGSVPVGASMKTQDVVGRGITVAVYSKEPVIESRLAPRGAGGGLAAMIPRGMRAFAIRVNEVVGVAGFVVAGMRVDILISGNRPGGDQSQGTLSKTLLQNIEVLSAGQDFKKDAEGKPIMVQVVNLLVTPEQAEQLSLAASQTTIQLVLRNPLDLDVAKTSGAAMRNLFNGGKFTPEVPPAPAPRQRAAAPPPVVKLPPPPPKKEEFTMEIIQGTKKNEMKFSGEGK
jgi:pilus assembly protein CpaB